MNRTGDPSCHGCVWGDSGQPLLSDEVFGNGRQDIFSLDSFTFKPVPIVKNTGTNKVFHLYVGLLVSESFGEVKFEVLQSQEVFSSGSTFKLKSRLDVVKGTDD